MTAHRRAARGWRAAPIVLLAMAGTALGCTGGGTEGAPTPGTAPGSSTPTSIDVGPVGTLPGPGSFVTTIVRDGLVEPVAVPGEPRRSNDDPRAVVPGTMNQFPLTVTFPPDWRDRNLVICGWTPADGFHECRSTEVLRETGSVDLGVPVRQPHDIYELWLLSSDTSRGLRRLVTLDSSTAPWPVTLHLPPGYERVNDVLTKQPPAGGNYLVGP